jgi:hypothetical protein
MPALSIESCDPQRLIRNALEADGNRGGWSARELYLIWLMALPIEIDAAHAAALLLERSGGCPAGDQAARDLLALLRTTSAYPRERLEPQPVCAARLH